MRRARSAIAVALTVAALALTGAAVPAQIDTKAPTAPSNVRVLEVMPTVVAVSFTGSTDDVGLKWYVVRVGDRQQATTSPSRTEFGGLRSETSYSLTVVAVDRAGNVSAPSAPVTFTTPSLPAPTDLRVTSAAGGSVSLAWNGPASWDPYRYLVYDNGRPEAVAKTEQLTMTGLAGGSHTFTVRAFHVSESVSPDGASVTVGVAPRGTDTTPPSPPGSPQVRIDEETYVFTTTWAAASDPVDPPSSLRYDVMQTWVGELFTAKYAVEGTTYVGAFSTAVRTVDPAGNRSAPATAVFVG